MRTTETPDRDDLAWLDDAAAPGDGDFAAAEQAFASAGERGAEAQYNLGNALARRFEDSTLQPPIKWQLYLTWFITSAVPMVGVLLLTAAVLIAMRL